MAAEEQVELEVSVWGDEAEVAMKTELLEQYEAEHPNVTIKKTYTDGGTYQAKLQMWFSSGKAPDVLGVANDLIEPYKDMGVIENYLSKRFAKETGMKFSKYLTNLRIQKAKYYMETGAYSVLEVAERVGCGQNPQYFSQIFKKNTGQSPSQYLHSVHSATSSGK